MNFFFLLKKMIVISQKEVNDCQNLNYYFFMLKKNEHLRTPHAHSRTLNKSTKLPKNPLKKQKKNFFTRGFYREGSKRTEPAASDPNERSSPSLFLSFSPSHSLSLFFAVFFLHVRAQEFAGRRLTKTTKIPPTNSFAQFFFF